MKARKVMSAVLAALFLTATMAAPAFAADQTMTGKVSDSMCGAKHGMGGGEVKCTRECVKGGSKYALVVGDKVYTLETSDKASLDKLNELAGASAKVTGDVKGDVITVKSVTGS